MSLIAELKRRNVFRVAVFYAVSAWLLLQVGDVLAGLFGLPEWSLRFVGFVLLLGFPVAIVCSWIYELTPEGVKLEKNLGDGPRITSDTGRKLDVATMALAALAIGLVAWQYFAPPANSTRADNDGRADRSQAVTATGASASQQPQTIAVLPFANLSADEENEFFADGVAEEVLNLLARASDLRVISRSSAFTFKGRQVSIPEVAQQLGATHVLEGSVRRSGNRVRVTAQLIGAADDMHLWSQTFDRELNDIFAVQDEIAAAIAQALQVTLDVQAPQSMDMTTYDLLLLARSKTSDRSGEGLRQALALLLRATSGAPDSAEAWGELAMTQLLLYTYINNSEEAGLKIRDYAQKALDIDPDNPSALTALASWHLLQIELDVAEALFLRALEANPNSVDANNWFGDFNMIIMDLDRAEKFETIATQLDPLLAVQFYNLGAVYHLAGDYATSNTYLRKGAELDPQYRQSGAMLLGNFAHNGDVSAIDAFMKDQPESSPMHELAPFFRMVAQQQLDEARRWFIERRKADPLANAQFWPFVDDWSAATLRLRNDPPGFPNYIWPWSFPTDPKLLRANPDYAAYWREPPRDRLLKARGHWIWED